MRIDKLLTNLKYGSRKEIESLINKGNVFVNNFLVKKKDFQVDPNEDTILVNGEKLFYREFIYLAINKPKNYLSANKDNLHKVVFELVEKPFSNFDLHVAGRLDLDSEGLMILTNDGELIHKITSPKNHVPKTYEVILDKPFNDAKTLLNGVMIKDGDGETFFAKAIEIEMLTEYCVKIIIDEGKFHQVKRMFKACGYTVLNLKRTAIGPLLLENLKTGEYIEFERGIFYD